MCGIVGLIGRSKFGVADQCQLQILSDSMVHRGPDGEGRNESPQCLIAMRRLSIIDLAGGWQPLFNEDKSISLVANGEVYNFAELRRQLEARGHTFRTNSDCETIVHLYEEHGDSFVDHLRGMYAFCLHDARRNRVLLVRDRMGEKPLYLVETADSLCFSSELRCLMRAGLMPFELDPQAVHEFYHYGYVPEPRCMIKGVRKLPAAHVLTIELHNFRQTERCYWRMTDAPPIEGDPAKIVRAELERVADLITRADVPVGIALSSGIDSSALAALAKRYRPDIRGFTVGYEGSPRQDERVAAKEFADHIGMPLTCVELRDSEVVDDFPNMVFMRDDPIADTAGSGYLAVMRAARDAGVRVMMMGHGGDELFWGYSWVRDALRRSHLKHGLHTNPPTTTRRDYLYMTKPPRSIRLGMRWLKGGGGLLSGYKNYRYDLDSPADRLIHYDNNPEFDAGAARLAAQATPAFLEQARHFDLTAPFAISPDKWSNIDVEISRLICQTYLAENGLAQGDRLSMAASVELRVPLVDYRLVETAIGLMKANPTFTPSPKKWLRDAFGDLVPDFVMNRPKTGFNAPWRRWVPKLMKQYGRVVADGYLVQGGFIKRGLGSDDVGFNTLSLEMWCQQMAKATMSKAQQMAIVSAFSNARREPPTFKASVA